MDILAILLGLTSAIIWYTHKPLRREMVWTGLFLGPVLALPTLINLIQATYQNQPFTLSLSDLAPRVIVGFCLAAISSVLYKLWLRPLITPQPHPNRLMLGWLVVGPISTSLLIFLQLDLLTALGIGLALDLAILIIWRQDLLFDALFSGLGMGLAYLFVFWITAGSLPGASFSLWSSSYQPLTHLSLPLMEGLTIFLLGAMAGPLYLVVKHTKERLLPIHKVYQSKTKLALILSFLLLGLGLLGWGAFQFAFAPQLVTAKSVQGLPLNSSVEITLTKPISQSSLQITLTPATPFSWHLTNSLYTNDLMRGLVLEPQTHWLPDTIYNLEINGVKAVLGLSAQNLNYSFQTISLPTIQTVTPADQAQAVAICEPLAFQLSANPSQLAEYEASLEPAVAVQTTVSGLQYQLKPERCLDQATTYTVRIRRYLIIEEAKLLDPNFQFNSQFSTRAAPTVGSLSLSGTQIPLATQSFTLSFQEPMLPNQIDLIQLEPALAGQFSWTSATLLQFKASAPLQADTTYTLTAKSGLKAVSGGQTTTESVFWFKTVAPVKVANLSPKHLTSQVKLETPIRIQFDQAVEPTSALAAISLTPTTSSQLHFEGNTLVISASLAKDTTYLLTVKPGVLSQNNGLPSITQYQSRFSTEESSLILPITQDFQDHSLSCEVASLKMALTYRGLLVSEESLIEQIGFDPTPKSNGVWGDPDQAFVGSVDGKQNSTGYGVHWDPIQSVASQYRTAHTLQSGSLTDLTAALTNGHPVIVWGIYPTGSYSDPWNTPTGKSIKAWKGEHVRLLIGFTGPANSPTNLILNDPITGRLKWTQAQFLANWATYQNNAVIVY